MVPFSFLIHNQFFSNGDVIGFQLAEVNALLQKRNVYGIGERTLRVKIVSNIFYNLTILADDVQLHLSGLW